MSPNEDLPPFAFLPLPWDRAGVRAYSFCSRLTAFRSPNHLEILIFPPRTVTIACASSSGWNRASSSLIISSRSFEGTSGKRIRPACGRRSRKMSCPKSVSIVMRIRAPVQPIQAADRRPGPRRVRATQPCRGPRHQANRQKTTGTQIYQKPHQAVICKESNLSCEIAAWAYARQARRSSGSRSG